MRFRTFCAVLAGLVLAACESGPAPFTLVPPPPPPGFPPPGPKGTSRIQPLASDLRVRAGDEVQLTVQVFTPDNVLDPDPVVEWEVSNPAVASISANGLLKFRADTILGSGNVVVRATAYGSTDTVVVLSRDWGYSGLDKGVMISLSPEPLPGVPLTLATASDNLTLGCENGVFGVNILTEDTWNGPHDIEYRFAGGLPRQETWVRTGTGMDPRLHAPEHSARSLAEEIFSADTLYARPSVGTERVWALNVPAHVAATVRSRCD